MKQAVKNEAVDQSKRRRLIMTTPTTREDWKRDFSLLFGEAPPGSLKYNYHQQIKSFIESQLSELATAMLGVIPEEKETVAIKMQKIHPMSFVNWEYDNEDEKKVDILLVGYNHATSNIKEAQLKLLEERGIKIK